MPHTTQPLPKCPIPTPTPSPHPHPDIISLCHTVDMKEGIQRGGTQFAYQVRPPARSHVQRTLCCCSAMDD